MEQNSHSCNFVEEWLNHFNIQFKKEVKINSKLSLDFFVERYGLGVFVVDWDRPISVQVVNRAIQIERELPVDHLYLIAREISEPARKTIDKFGNNIKTIHPNGLSELAVHFVNIFQTNIREIPA